MELGRDCVYCVELYLSNFSENGCCCELKVGGRIGAGAVSHCREKGGV